MKIVQFKNGKYGVRKGWLNYKYLSIYDAINCSCVKWSGFFPIHHFYMGTLEEAKNAMNWIDDSGEELKQ